MNMDDAMDMEKEMGHMSGGNMSAAGMSGHMMTAFHASAGDTLWIAAFTPTTGAATFGACVLLFFLGLLTRFLDSLQRSLTLRWAATASNLSLRPTSDVPRGALFLLQAFFVYLMMLAVMTYNAYYLVSILIGLAVGETFFGRFGRPHMTEAGARMSSSAEAAHAHRQDESEPLTLHIDDKHGRA